jgi:protease-4
MRTCACLALVVIALVSLVFADSEIPRYHTYDDYLMSSPGSMGYGLYGFANPAVLGQTRGFDLLFTWSGTSDYFDDFDRWGLFASLPVPKLGFGAIRDQTGFGTVTDYRLSTAFGSKASSFGVGYGWSGGDTGAYRRGKVVTVGTLARPVRYLSLGLSGTFATSGSAREGLLDVGVRPLGNEILTVFADYAPQGTDRFEDAPWSAGLAVEPLAGVRLTGRYLDNHAVTVGLNLSLGRMGLGSQGHSDQNRKRSYNTYGVRIGAMDRTFLRSLTERNKRYLHLDLKGPIKYQRFKWFDRSNTLMGLLDAIDAAGEDPTIAGIALNMSGMQVDPEMAWEIRDALREFKARGKKVVVYVDNAQLREYQFASVADRIVLDPISDLFLLGIRGGRFYLKGTLEKLGIGFDEWRFFKYKSAYEVFSRDSMSEGDREQIQAIVDDFYDLARSEVCEGRGISSSEFDRLVDDEMLILSDDAMEMGLVDTVGRWEAVKDVIEDLEGEKKAMVGAGALAKYELPDDGYWGERPKIAVIYGLGVCAMDEGIKARSLEKVFDAVAGRRDIKAVVFRVDSPGGDALASDIVAEAMKRCRERKPLIVSQGYVAGSGGYWISMYADTIVASPTTITGSIGVIGGWFYNEGLKEKLGMSTDLVKAGDHADLGYGITLPLVGQLPDRNLTSDERAKFEHNIEHYYDVFVDKVAAGRHMDAEDVYKIAQGRIWSGSDGLRIGLVDVLGGMETAIMIAKEKAGIPPDEDVDIVQLPEPELFNPAMFTPKLFGVESSRNEALEHLEFRLEHNGEVMPLLPLDLMDPYLEVGSRSLGR